MNTERSATISAAASESELDAAIWAVISFDSVEAAGVSFDDARKKMAELEAKGIAGLCIVTVDTAERAGAQNSSTPSPKVSLDSR
jgi:hypothetical protein